MPNQPKRNQIKPDALARLEPKIMLMASAKPTRQPLVVGPKTTRSEFNSALARHRKDGTPLTLRGGNYDNAAKRSNIERALNEASNVRFQPGTYNINDRINVTLGKNKKLTVNATGATFVSDNIDNDFFRIAGGNSSKGKALTNAKTESAKSRLRTDLQWTGGVFDISGSKVAAKYRPKRENEPKGSNRIGTAATTDGLSIKGFATGNTKDHAIGKVTIRDLEVNGVGVDSKNRWDKSGGDSGLFITDVDSIDVRDSKFIGTRDAGVYVSDKDGVGTKSVVFENNLFDGNHDGFAAKRGIDNVRVRNNTFLRNENSIAFTRTPDIASRSERSQNNSITGNFIASTSGKRSLQLQAADADVKFNGFYRGYGSKAGMKKALGDAILLEHGAKLSSTENDNTIKAIKNSEIDGFSDSKIATARRVFKTNGSRNTIR